MLVYLMRCRVSRVATCKYGPLCIRVCGHVRDSPVLQLRGPVRLAHSELVHRPDKIVGVPRHGVPLVWKNVGGHQCSEAPVEVMPPKPRCVVLHRRTLGTVIKRQPIALVLALESR